MHPTKYNYLETSAIVRNTANLLLGLEKVNNSYVKPERKQKKKLVYKCVKCGTHIKVKDVEWVERGESEVAYCSVCYDHYEPRGEYMSR